MARKTETPVIDRVRPQYSVLRQGVIHAMASRGIPTADIAAALGVNRSYVIRLTDFGVKPLGASEKAIAKAAREYEAALRKLGMGFAFGEGFTTTLAGDDGKRGKGGGRPRKDAKPAKPVPRAKPKPGPVAESLAKQKKASKANIAKAQAAKAAKPKAAKPAAVPKKAAKPSMAKAAKPKPIRDAKIGKRAAPRKARASTPAESSAPVSAASVDPAAVLDTIIDRE